MKNISLKMLFSIAFLLLFINPLAAQNTGNSSDERQTADAAKRIAVREQLKVFLENSVVATRIAFQQSEKQQFNFIGKITNRLENSESMEVVVSVSPQSTINFRVYPHYKGGYINLDKVKDSAGLMKMLLELNSRTFYYWGADAAGDVFAGYSITLESGFPPESITIVLRSIRNLDEFVGTMKTFV